MNEQSRDSHPYLEVSDEQYAYMEELSNDIARELNHRLRNRVYTETSNTIQNAYRRMYTSAVDYIVELFEFSVNTSVGSWLAGDTVLISPLAKEIFVQRMSFELPCKLEELFSEMRSCTLATLDQRFEKELTDRNFISLPYSYLDLENFEQMWCERFSELALQTVLKRIDLMKLDKLFPPCDSEEDRNQMIQHEMLTLLCSDDYQVGKIRELISFNYKGYKPFSEFTDHVSASVKLWLKKVREYGR